MTVSSRKLRSLGDFGRAGGGKGEPKLMSSDQGGAGSTLAGISQEWGILQGRQGGSSVVSSSICCSASSQTSHSICHSTNSTSSCRLVVRAWWIASRAWRSCTVAKAPSSTTHDRLLACWANSVQLHTPICRAANFLINLQLWPDTLEQLVVGVIYGHLPDSSVHLIPG